MARQSLPSRWALISAALILIAVVERYGAAEAFSIGKLHHMPCSSSFARRRLSKCWQPSWSAAHTSLSMSAGEMHTGYEWLAREKDETGKIRWMEIVPNEKDARSDDLERSNSSSNAETDTPSSLSGDNELLKVPLYPLGAVHLPSGHVQTLNNMAPQSIRMAKDLLENNKSQSLAFNGRFCVTLKAADTGRIATIGTLMKVVDTEELKSYDGSLLGIRVQCVAEGLVQINGIDNPECWTRERRIKKSDEYLVATVRKIDVDVDTNDITYPDEADANDIQSVAEQVADDFAVVRSMYANKDGVAAMELPPWAVDAVQNNLPCLTEQNFTTTTSATFWKAADVWQTLCNTVREARRSDLQSEVNEITIDAAIKKGGPLKLPVHRSDLPQDVQLRLNKMEEEAAKNFVAMGMDPVLDFQTLLSADSHLERVRHLGNMVARERRRLEAKESLKSVFDDSKEEATTREDEEEVASINTIGDLLNATSIFQ